MMLNSNSKKTESYFRLYTNSGTSACFVTKSKFAISEYSKLCVNVASTSGTVTIGLCTKSSVPMDYVYKSTKTTNAGVVELELPTSSDEYFVFVGASGTSVDARIDEIWFVNK